MLDGMEGSTMGIWVAHGEGRCHFPDELVEQMVLENDLAPVRYADTDGRMASVYPSNPNGSPHGIAALCSADGRHLAMMPHPERCAQPPSRPPEPHTLPCPECTLVCPPCPLMPNCAAVRCAELCKLKFACLPCMGSMHVSRVR